VYINPFYSDSLYLRQLAEIYRGIFNERLIIAKNRLGRNHFVANICYTGRMKNVEANEAQVEKSPFKLSYYGHAEKGPDGKVAYLNIYRSLQSTSLSLPGKPVVELKFRQATPTEIAEEKSLPERLYWAWLQNGADHFIMIYSHKSLFETCFLYGPYAEVNAGEGKIYRLVVEKATELK
jgi:hypothetical protein